MIFVARLNARNVYADVPEAEHANAQRTVSRTDIVNSPSRNTVICDAMLSTKTLRSGRLKISHVDNGRSKEPL